MFRHPLRWFAALVLAASASAGFVVSQAGEHVAGASNNTAHSVVHFEGVTPGQTVKLVTGPAAGHIMLYSVHVANGGSRTNAIALRYGATGGLIQQIFRTTVGVGVPDEYNLAGSDGGHLDTTVGPSELDLVVSSADPTPVMDVTVTYENVTGN